MSTNGGGAVDRGGCAIMGVCQRAVGKRQRRGGAEERQRRKRRRRRGKTGDEEEDGGCEGANLEEQKEWWKSGL